MGNNRDDPLSFMNSSSSLIGRSERNGYIGEPNISLIRSASGCFQNDRMRGGGGGEGVSGRNSNVEFGFKRQEFRNTSLVGTVQFYDRHIFLCYKDPQVWPPHIEASEFDRLPRHLAASLLVKKREMKKRTRLTVCEGHDGTEISNGDILIFPDMIRYRQLTHFDVDAFVEEVLIKDNEWLPGTPETLTGSYVFVCSHGSRDRRCGVCGPAVIARFKEEIDARGLQGQVSVSPCSHIGGHKYAGNVIIFSPNCEGVMTGHWYGYVTPNDVPLLLEQHIGKGVIIDQLWRGQMGLSEEDQKKSQVLRLQLCSEPSLKKSSKEAIQVFDVSPPIGNGTEMKVSGCCRGNGNENSSCCQNSSLPKNLENNHVINEKKNKASSAEKKKKKNEKQALRSSSGQVTPTHKLCAILTWFESWEREDTYAALAVVGAVASVAIAYSSYKRLR